MVTGRRDYTPAYLRRTYREEGKAKNETAANLSAVPITSFDLIEAGLKGQQPLGHVPYPAVSASVLISAAIARL